MEAPSSEPRAVLVVGDGPLGRAVAARLAAVTRVMLGAVDPSRLGPTLAEVERVRGLYGRSEVPALAVAGDAAALVRTARQVLPPGHAVILADAVSAADLEAVRTAAADDSPVVLVAPTPAVRRDAEEAGHALRTVWVEASPAWSGVRAQTAAEATAARAVRDALFPSAAGA